LKSIVTSSGVGDDRVGVVAELSLLVLQSTPLPIDLRAHGLEETRSTEVLRICGKLGEEGILVSDACSVAR